jgi:hypothetical protein
LRTLSCCICNSKISFDNCIRSAEFIRSKFRYDGRWFTSTSPWYDTFGRPTVPFFVVSTITPFAAFTP